MVKIDLTKEEVEKITAMLENSSVPLIHAEKALVLYNKFKEAKE